MKICLIGPGISPIPPLGYGAVESLVWDYKNYLEANGQKVLIVNTQDSNSAFEQCKNFNPDVIHIQYDDYVFWADNLFTICPKIFITSHYGYVAQPHRIDGPYWNIFNKFVSSGVKILASSEEIKKNYISRGKNPEDVILMHNGADVNKIRFAKQPTFPDKSLYLAKLTSRKRQSLVYGLPNINFAGNCDGTMPLPPSGYLGEWTQDQLFEGLTEYGNLLLFSDGEAHALVICDALAAGLGVVVSEYAVANLDVSKPFIDVIPEYKMFDKNYVQQVIQKNKEISLSMREEIREYAKSNFDWSVLIKRYIEVIQS